MDLNAVIDLPVRTKVILGKHNTLVAAMPLRALNQTATRTLITIMETDKTTP